MSDTGKSALVKADREVRSVRIIISERKWRQWAWSKSNNGGLDAPWHDRMLGVCQEDASVLLKSAAASIDARENVFLGSLGGSFAFSSRLGTKRQETSCNESRLGSLDLTLFPCSHTAATGNVHLKTLWGLNWLRTAVRGVEGALPSFPEVKRPEGRVLSPSLDLLQLQSREMVSSGAIRL